MYYLTTYVKCIVYQLRFNIVLQYFQNYWLNVKIHSIVLKYIQNISNVYVIKQYIALRYIQNTFITHSYLVNYFR